MSNNREHILNIIFIFIATATLGAILGLAVLRTVDTRLSDISVNIPPIKVPQSKITVEYPKQLLSLLSENANQYQYVRQLNSDNDRQLLIDSNQKLHIDNGQQMYNQQMYGGGEMQIKNEAPTNAISNLAEELESTSTDNDRSIIELNQNKRAIIRKTDRQQLDNRNFYLGNRQLASQQTSNFELIPSNKDIQLRKPIKDLSYDSGELHQYTQNGYYDQPNLPKQYYKDISEMTGRQMMKFKKYAKIDKMTILDYVNWLVLFVNEPEELNNHHRQNLYKIKNGIQLTENDIPHESNYPKTASEYYQQLYEPQ